MDGIISKKNPLRLAFMDGWLKNRPFPDTITPVLNCQWGHWLLARKQLKALDVGRVPLLHYRMLQRAKQCKHLSGWAPNGRKSLDVATSQIAARQTHPALMRPEQYKRPRCHACQLWARWQSVAWSGSYLLFLPISYSIELCTEGYDIPGRSTCAVFVNAGGACVLYILCVVRCALTVVVVVVVVVLLLVVIAACSCSCRSCSCCCT